MKRRKQKYITERNIKQEPLTLKSVTVTENDSILLL